MFVVPLEYLLLKFKSCGFIGDAVGSVVGVIVQFFFNGQAFFLCFGQRFGGKVGETRKKN